MTVVNFYNIDCSSRDLTSIDTYKFNNRKEAEDWLLGEHYRWLYDEGMLDEKWKSEEHFIENNDLETLENNNELFDGFEYNIV